MKLHEWIAVKPPITLLVAVEIVRSEDNKTAIGKPSGVIEIRLRRRATLAGGNPLLVVVHALGRLDDRGHVLVVAKLVFGQQHPAGADVVGLVELAFFAFTVGVLGAVGFSPAQLKEELDWIEDPVWMDRTAEIAELAAAVDEALA